MPRLVRLTLVTVVLVVVLTGAILGVLFFYLDEEDYLDIAGVVLEEALGWNLEVHGPVSVERSLNFALAGRDLILTRGQTRLAAAKQATFRLQLAALLRGKFQFEVDVKEPHILFTLDADGRTSWNFEQFIGRGGSFFLRPIIAGIRVGKGHVAVHDEASGVALEVHLDRLLIQEADSQIEFVFRFNSAYKGHDFRAYGKIRSDYEFNALAPDFSIALLRGDSTAPTPAGPEIQSEKVHATGTVAPRLDVSGKVVDPFDALRTDLALSLHMRDLSPLGRQVDGLPGSLSDLGPLTAKGRLTGSKDEYMLEGIEVSFDTRLPSVGPLHATGELELGMQSLRVKGLKASLGKSDLAGSMALYTKGEKPRLIVDLSSRRLQLDEFFTPEESGEAEAQKTAPQGQPDRVFSDEPLPLDWLNRLNARIRVKAGHLMLYRVFTDVRFAVDIDNGALEGNFALQLGDGSMNTRLRIDNSRSPPSLLFSEQTNGVPMSFILGLPQGIIIGGKVNGQAHFEGQGETPQAVAASLHGTVLHEMGEARLIEAGLTKVSADLLSGMLDSLSPTSPKKDDRSEEGYTDYRCGVFGIRIKDGIARSERTIALESEKFIIGGKGYVDLKEETIHLAIRPKPITGLGLSLGTLVGGFAVGGTLASPQVQLNKTGIALTATIGAVFHLLDGWANTKDFTCENTLQRIKEQLETERSQD